MVAPAERPRELATLFVTLCALARPTPRQGESLALLYSQLTSKKRLLSVTETPRQRVRSSVESLGHASTMEKSPSPVKHDLRLIP
jgi:hypothetical protein